MEMICTLIELTKGALELGLIYSLVVLSMFLTSNILSFDDLTVEGSFALGGALTAVLLGGLFPAWLVVVVSALGGGLAGLATGLLHTRLHVNNLVSGIVVTTALFSVNLKIAGPMVSLVAANALFGEHDHLFMLGGFCLALVVLVARFLATEVGLVLKALGANPQMLTSLGKSINGYTCFGLMLANAITALAGSLFVQHVGFFSIGGVVGTLAVALAGLMLGHALCKRSIAAVVVGAVLYQAIITATISLQIDPLWNKFITAALIIALMLVQRQRLFVDRER